MEGTPTAVVPATPVTITAAARRPPDVNQLAVRQQLDVKARQRPSVLRERWSLR